LFEKQLIFEHCQDQHLSASEGRNPTSGRALTNRPLTAVRIDRLVMVLWVPCGHQRAGANVQKEQGKTHGNSDNAGPARGIV